MKVEPEATSLVAVSGDGVRFPGGWTWGCQGSGIQGQWRGRHKRKYCEKLGSSVWLRVRVHTQHGGGPGAVTASHRTSIQRASEATRRSLGSLQSNSNRRARCSGPENVRQLSVERGG